MKKDIHPKDYRAVVFQDTSCDYSFLAKSTVETKETIKWEDGKEYPLYKLDISDYVIPIADEFIKEGDIQIKDVKIKGIDLMEIKLEVLFNLENKTKIEFQISKLDVQIYTSPSYTTLVGSTSIDESFTVFSDTLNVFKSNVNVNTLSMGSALFSNTMNSANSFYIKVNSIVNYNNIEIPFTIKRRVDYNPLTLDIELHE